MNKYEPLLTAELSVLTLFNSDKMKTTLMVFAFLCATISSSVFSKETEVELKLPLVEYPYNFMYDKYRAPGMNQSLELTKTVNTVKYDGLGYLFGDYKKTGFAVILFSDIYLLSYLPFGFVWVHEEWHRAVMGRRGIDSHNDVYNFDFGAKTIAVSHIRDSDLSSFKKNHPAEFVRMSSAGSEAEVELYRSSSENYFFGGRDPYFQRAGWIMSLLNNTLYIYTCSTKKADTMTNKMNKKEKKIESRDFTGLDFTAWAYDLYRPNEPYSARGKHVSGNGIDRYIKYSDLSPDEKRLIKLQWKLSLLNFISPVMINFQTLPVPDGNLRAWNFSMAHYLAPFGYSVDLNTMFRTNRANFAIRTHKYFNEKKSAYLWGLDAELIRYKPAFFNQLPLSMGGRMFAWTQPENQMFHSSSIRPGAMIAMTLNYSIYDDIEIYETSTVKSQGWVAGNIDLEKSFTQTIGLQYIF